MIHNPTVFMVSSSTEKIWPWIEWWNLSMVLMIAPADGKCNTVLPQELRQSFSRLRRKIHWCLGGRLHKLGLRFWQYNRTKYWCSRKKCRLVWSKVDQVPVALWLSTRILLDSLDWSTRRRLQWLLLGQSRCQCLLYVWFRRHYVVTNNRQLELRLR